MDKKNRSLIITIVSLMAVIGVILIILVSIQSKVEDKKEALESTTEKEEVVLDDNVEDEEAQNSSAEKDFANSEGFDYNADIKERVQTTDNTDKLLTINGTSYGIPCLFKDIKNEFNYVEEVPEKLGGNEYIELHALSGDINTGLSLVVINPSEQSVSINDMYVQTIWLTEKTSPADISIGSLKIGAQMEDIENFIKAGGYEYEVTESEYEKLFLIDIDGESVSLMLMYDTEGGYVYKMVLEYVIA